eukprot:jgi/Bigna1/82355/fgenesh1_pg.91_\
MKADSLERLASVAEMLTANVVVPKLRHRLRKYKDAFIGQKAVSFMCEQGLANSREEAVRLGNILLGEGFIRHVHGDHTFKDEYLFYNVIKSTPFSYDSKTMVGESPTDSKAESGPPTEKEASTIPKFSRISSSPTRSNLAQTMSRSGDWVGSGKIRPQRLDLLEILLAQCNEKANYLETEMAHLREAVVEITSSLTELRARCDSMQTSYREMLAHCRGQARVMVVMGLLFSASVGASHESLWLFFALILGVLILGKDAFVIGEISGSSSKVANDTIDSTERDQKLPSPTTSSTADGLELDSNNAAGRESRSASIYEGQLFQHLQLTDKLRSSTGSEGKYASPSTSVGLEFNTTKGIPFENENFKGRVIFKLRTDDDNKLNAPYQGYFRGRARKFSLQIQGKFKKDPPPNAIVWLGAEVGHCDKSKGEDRMVLSFIRRTFCRIILNTINLMRGAILHYSFGDGKQLPHITLPLFVAADTFVETDEGKNAPPIGVDMFPEDAKSCKARRKTKPADKQYSADKTYSFSLHNSNLDAYNWSVVGIPGIKSMSLSQFWSDMPLRIVAYVTDGPFSDPHGKDDKKYLFCFQLKNSYAKKELGKKN